MKEQQIYEISRPHPKLMTHYFIQSIFTFFIAFPVLYFRYHTMHYRFDDEGVHMRWGILFRREINLTYARIQDIHLTSGIIQRWLGLADIQIQTASGSARAEMKIEGLLEYELIRDFLYRKMRGARDGSNSAAASTGPSAGASAQINPQALELLREIHQEMKAARETLQNLSRRD